MKKGQGAMNGKIDITSHHIRSNHGCETTFVNGVNPWDAIPQPYITMKKKSAGEKANETKQRKAELKRLMEGGHESAAN